MPYFYYGYGSNWTLFYILFFAVAIFSVWAQYKVNSTFKKYSKVIARNGKTGKQAAEMVLASNDVRGVAFEKTAGSL
ncbi:MAG: zinc metallopeptidase, partial [Clostridia bacterium]|nr:zinc metallopeptidase [Clostridia bacterium]